jgi:Na+/proline symporter
MNSLRTLDLIIIAIYFVAVAAIGLKFARRQTTTEAYFVARRSIPHWAMGLSIFATIISSITFIAYPGAAFSGNWNLLVPGFMAVGVLLLLGTTLVSFFRHAVGMSAYEYFEKRFGYGARAYSALAFTAGHFSKMGFVLFTITTAICGMTGWDKYRVIIAVAVGAFIARKGDGALALYYAATAIVSAGLAGMFLLAFFSRRANRQGLWIGIVTALIFTAWATLTGGKYKMLDLGWNYTWPDVMIGVGAHIIVLMVGYAASFLFPADKNVKTEWTFWGWLEQRKTLGTKTAVSPAAVEVNP